MDLDTYKQRILIKNDEIQLITDREVSDTDTLQLKKQFKDLLEGILPLNEALSDISEEADSLPFGLSDMQYAYVIGRNPGVELGGRSSSLYMEVDIEKCDLEALTNSLNFVIGLHPMLRAVIVNDGKQKILDDLVPYKIETTDISSLSDSEQQASLEQIRREMEELLLPLDKAPLFNIRATLLKNQLVRLNLFFDLLFVDMQSVKIMLRDWFQHYQHGAVDSAVERPEFSQYLKGEALFTETEQGRKDRAYWQNLLDKLPASPELPINTPPSLINTPRLQRISRAISAKLIDNLKMVSLDRGITLESLFLGSYAEVIRQWSKNQSFTITFTQMSRRGYFDGIENTVGNFLQPVLLPVHGEKYDSFIERLIQIQTDSLTNQLYSSHNSIKVLRELTKRNSENRTASFPIVFSNTLDANLQDVVAGSPFPGINPVYSSNKTPQVWLENQITCEGDTVWVNWNFVDELFPSGMIEQMLDAYIHLLTSCASDDGVFERSGSLVSIPNTDNQERLLANDTEVDLAPDLLHEQVLAAANKYPDQVALVQGDYKVTFKELFSKAKWIACAISEKSSISPNDMFAVSLEQGPDLVIAIMGILMSGAAYVSIDPNLPQARKVKILERCAAKGVVGDSNSLADLGSAELNNINILNYVEQELDLEILPSPQSLDDLAYIIFTSGSTGEPKGVMISHRNASNTVLDINRQFNVTKDDVVLSVAPAGFDLSVYDYFGVLAAGGRVVFGKPEATHDPQAWYEVLVAQGVTIWNSVPAPMKALVDKNGENLTNTKLRLVLMSGDWIPVDLPGRINEILPKCEVISLGGATEGSIWSIFYRIKQVDEKWSSIPYGKPLANQRFHVLNDWLSDCPKWVTGELYIAGDGVAQGYIGDQEKTAQRFFKHPETGEMLYKTGDLGKYIEDGFIEILGREDSQVKINGYRVELGEIEVCLLMHDKVSHVVVGAPTHPKTGQRHIVAWVVSKDGDKDLNNESLREELKALAQQELPNYMFPSYYVLIPEMPLTGNGKINHAALPEPWQHLENDDGNIVEPGNDIEVHLLRLWREQLQHEDFDVSSGFFDIGGDSLHAVALIGSIRDQYGINPETEQDIVEGLFMNSSIQYFSEIIQKGKDSDTE